MNQNIFDQMQKLHFETVLVSIMIICYVTNITTDSIKYSIVHGFQKKDGMKRLLKTLLVLNVDVPLTNITELSVDDGTVVAKVQNVG